METLKSIWNWIKNKVSSMFGWACAKARPAINVVGNTVLATWEASRGHKFRIPRFVATLLIPYGIRKVAEQWLLKKSALAGTGNASSVFESIKMRRAAGEQLSNSELKFYGQMIWSRALCSLAQILGIGFIA